MMKRMLMLLLTLCLLCACALAEESIAALTPARMNPIEGFEPVALYCGPTQGFYRHEEQTIDLAAPFVCFGQFDCWTMVAQGTPEDFGPVGWIEGGLFDAKNVPELAFEDGYAAMIEESASVTTHPDNGVWDVTLPYGTMVTVLAGYGDLLYVQTEIAGVPARVFIPAYAI